ncbi:MAG: bifunctional nuclease family protein [Thermoanaerobaculia bacterium]|nr:bifunctional nuclease family protein [Thermoanaerobaculia bacterium]
MTMVRMTVKGLMLDPISNSPIVVLRDDDDSTLLPIWVGVFEANAIALKLENYETPRPMTHDLLKGILGAMDAKVIRVVVNELRDSTFFARIVLSVGGNESEVDARPSDAIALALRVDAPIFVDQSVLDQAQTISPDDTQDEKVRKWFEQLNPEELGKYKM